ncbi:RNA polymerase III subunit RPC82-related, helix-turn-helix [Lasallia pustulata]|uniref:DNA-directed RNA polymerase III subunit RPC3 n=1 Tax=Lasallia pustulata TaxID=136370 RepID=A0A1W5D9Q3_9LECA|nr:RNA polymerase III subunit RPC82-related, helix-turn-helix [Lasallia pustulata]
MSQHATELCILLVDDTYGALTSCVFQTLRSYGRLPFRILLQHTDLSPNELKHSLAVLIQQHLVLWYTPLGDETTYYEAHWPSAYALARSGKLVKIVEDRFGDLAGDLLSNLLLLGHARVGDLAKAYNAVQSDGMLGSVSEGQALSEDGLPNGLGNNHTSAGTKKRGPNLEDLHSVLDALLRTGFIIPVHESHFRSAADNRSEAERELKRNNDSFQGALKGEKKMEFEQAIDGKLDQWRDGLDMQTKDTSGRGRKRRLEDDRNGVDRKRMRMSNGLANGMNGHAGHPHALDDFYLDDNLVLRVNHDKFAVAARSARLIELSERYISKATSRVYAQLLSRLEGNLLRCNNRRPSEDDDEDDPTSWPTSIPANELSPVFQEDVDLAGAIGRVAPNKVDRNRFIHPKKRRKKTLFDSNDAGVENVDSTDEDEDMGDIVENGNISEVNEDRDLVNGDADYGSEVKVEKEDHFPIYSDVRSRVELIRQHLLLLAEHPLGFAEYIKRTPTKPEQWTINFRSLARQLRQMELENTIATRFGPGATRLVRIFLEKGKLDEKAITSIGLINQKLMRSILTAMHEAGYLELQEIPRDNARQPSRTMFLWYFDPDRCRQKLLEETYKAMARCLQRARVEKEAVQLTVDKANRTDVVGKEDEYLGVDERMALSTWREKEERLLGEVGRLDDLVAVLRDF